MGRFLALVAFAGVILIWRGTASAESAPQWPLVFVPGILGSRLCDATNNIIWGTASSLSNFARLELDASPPASPLHPCGLVDEIQIFGTLWTHNTYKSWLKGLSAIGFSPEKSNLFIFDYDWRLSNIENASNLDSFVKKYIAPDQKFDIVAHSMGGLVTRIYLDGYDSAKSVRQVIYLGSPFLGSMNTFGTIKEGWGWPFTNLAGGKDLVARVALSFPAMLEMLPRYDECCYIRRLNNSRQYLDVFDPQVWQSLHWLPETYSSPATFARFSQELERSKNLTLLLSKPAPAGVYETIFASDAYDTLRLLGMKEGATAPEQWVFTSSKGDGTVPVWSVARRMNSDNYANTLPSFAKHEHLFDDKWVDGTIFRILASGRPNEPFQIAAPGRPAIQVRVNEVSTVWPVSIATLVLDKKLYKPGEIARAELTIEFEDTAADLTPGVYKPDADLVQAGQSRSLDVKEITGSQDLEAKHLRFMAAGAIGSDEGIGVIVFHVEGSLEPSQAFYVSLAPN